jgi:hypothetical protein
MPRLPTTTPDPRTVTSHVSSSWNPGSRDGSVAWSCAAGRVSAIRGRCSGSTSRSTHRAIERSTVERTPGPRESFARGAPGRGAFAGCAARGPSAPRVASLPDIATRPLRVEATTSRHVARRHRRGTSGWLYRRSRGWKSTTTCTSSSSSTSSPPPCWLPRGRPSRPCPPRRSHRPQQPRWMVHEPSLRRGLASFGVRSRCLAEVGAATRWSPRASASNLDPRKKNMMDSRTAGDEPVRPRQSVASVCLRPPPAQPLVTFTGDCT